MIGSELDVETHLQERIHHPMNESNYHYHALISYNHRDDKVATWLQLRLEHYKLPSVALKV